MTLGGYRKMCLAQVAGQLFFDHEGQCLAQMRGVTRRNIDFGQHDRGARNKDMDLGLLRIRTPRVADLTQRIAAVRQQALPAVQHP